MRRRIVWMILAGVPLALITLAAGTAVAFPAARHIASALWNLPDRLPALPENSQVHFEPGAEDYAHDVAALLPAAIAKVEADEKKIISTCQAPGFTPDKLKELYKQIRPGTY